MRGGWLWGVGMGVALTFAAAAGAQTDETSKRTARQLGNEGIELYEQGSYDAAVDKLERAYAIYPATTLGLWAGRALVKVGRLVEASERFVAVGKTALDADAPEALREAQREAESEYEALQPRIPTLEIVLEGPDASAGEVQVDGKPIKAAMIGVPFGVNPGKRTVVATAGTRRATREITLREGAQERLVIDLGSAPPGSAPPPAPPPASGEAPPPAPAAGPDVTAERGGDGQRTMAWVALGVGGAGLAVGAITGVIALNKESDFSDQCVDTRCPPSLRDEVDSFKTMRTMSSVGFIVGGIGLGAGAVLLLTAPSEPQAAQPHAEAWVGVGRVGVRGRF